MKYIDLDFVKPDKDCVSCDYHNNYTCFFCEDVQVRDKYPKAIYTTDVIPPEWYINE